MLWVEFVLVCVEGDSKAEERTRRREGPHRGVLRVAGWPKIGAFEFFKDDALVK